MTQNQLKSGPNQLAETILHNFLSVDDFTPTRQVGLIAKAMTAYMGTTQFAEQPAAVRQDEHELIMHTLSHLCNAFEYLDAHSRASNHL